MVMVVLKRVAAYRRLVPLAFDYLYDFRRYAKYSSTIHAWNDEEKLRAVITALYHNVEKGLSLSHPRPGFGKDVIKKLVAYMLQLIENYGAKDYLRIPLSVLESYKEFNDLVDHPVDWLSSDLDRIRSSLESVGCMQSGGVEARTRDGVLADISRGGTHMLMARSSCRQFSDEYVDDNAVLEAVKVAQKSPVVCNRQSGKIRIFRDKALIDRILDFHGGARGFAPEVKLLFCISTDIRNFNGRGERYQGWIDGGMFAMSFVFGLHAQGIASCCLNWSKSMSQDVEMRRLLGVPEFEKILMFVAAGKMLDSFRVASSVRKPVRDVVVGYEFSGSER